MRPAKNADDVFIPSFGTDDILGDHVRFCMSCFDDSPEWTNWRFASARQRSPFVGNAGMDTSVKQPSRLAGEAGKPGRQ